MEKKKEYLAPECEEFMISIEAAILDVSDPFGNNEEFDL